jgi:hypothetical protein
MADPLGKRSVEIVVFNHTNADLTVQGPAAGSACAWAPAQQPNTGDTLPSCGAAKWGVTSNDVLTTVQGWLALSGLGEPMVEISFSNDQSDTTQCTATSNSRIRARVEHQPSGRSNHPLWTVTLTSAHD